jgi:hypothetical protein
VFFYDTINEAVKKIFWSPYMKNKMASSAYFHQAISLTDATDNSMHAV